MKKPKVGQDLCIACGNCIAIVPDVFEFGGPEGKSQVKPLKDYKPHEKKINEAIKECPVKTISWGE